MLNEGTFKNQEAEGWLLGGLISNNKMLFEIGVESSDFYFGEHQKIFDIMQRCFIEKQRFDMADLVQSGIDREYLYGICDSSVPVSSSILGYAEIVKENSRKRKILDAINSAVIALGSSNSTDALSVLQSGIAGNLDTGGLKTAEKVYEEIIASLELPPKCYKTGLESLDLAMGGGLYESYTYGLGGAEKAGKTTFAHTISHNLSEAGTKHLYVALEMGSQQIEQKNISRKLQCNSLNFINKRDMIKGKIHEASPNLNTIYLDAAGFDLPTILQNVTVAKLKYGITGFIVDYWQLVEGKEFRDSEERHLRTVAQGIANYARRNQLWCLLLAQLNQDGKLFGGNGLRKACDQLYFIKQPEGLDNKRWLSMDVSRYTPKADVGSDIMPRFVIDARVGPYVDEC